MRRGKKLTLDARVTSLCINCTTLL